MNDGSNDKKWRWHLLPNMLFKTVGVLKITTTFFGLKAQFISARDKVKRRPGIIGVENGCAL